MASAEKAKVATEMLREGSTLDAIAKRLGYKSASGPAMLIRRHIRELPRQALEDLQKELLADLEVVHSMAMKDAQDRDPMTRDRAQRRMIRAIEARARISGIVKAPPPMVIMQAPTTELDLSRLSVEQLEQLKTMQEQFTREAITVHAEPPMLTESTEGEKENGSNEDRNGS